jgi:hypothetical protein
MPGLDVTAQCRHVAAQPSRLKRLFDHVLEMRRLEGFRDEVVRASLHGTNRGFDAAMGGDDDGHR